MRIGFFEIILISIVALFALGPEKMPIFAKEVGKAVSAFKSYTSKLTEEINESVVQPMEEVKESIEPIKKMANPLENINKKNS